ncbi:MAG: prolyl oligopeptidase family serine peptidase [Bacteroidetes bacterium]|nr:prolyl oligopeptidase family serine peptidase [Bacteroidota bacterium]
MANQNISGDKRIRVFLFIFLIFAAMNANAQKILGDWEGKINVGVDVKIVFHFTINPDSTLSGTMDSPDQNVIGIPLSKVIFVGDSIHTELQMLKAIFKGRTINDTTIDGTWYQSNSTFPLILYRQISKKEIVKLRPQTPKPPFDYHSEDVVYFNKDSSIQFGATLTFPKKGGPFPVALLITGSGQQDRDETIFNHKPFAVIADYLTKNGFATLRIDDRGKGQTTGVFAGSTSADFANDVLAGIQYLSQRNEIDKTKIGLIGHSEGGMIAPMVYSKWPHLAFIVSLAGTGIPGSEILLRQQTDPLKNLVSDSVFNAFYNLTQHTLDIIRKHPGSPDSFLLDSIKSNYINWKKNTPLYIQQELHANTATPDDYAKQVSQELSPWYKFFISTDPTQYWDQVKCPVLALNGEKDIQVYLDQNIPAIQHALQKAGNKNVTIKIFPDLNHLFQHCNQCTVEEYDVLTETFSVEVLETISNWLHQTIH